MPTLLVDAKEREVARFALASRVAMWALCLLSSILVPDYDSSSRLLSQPSSSADVVVFEAVGMLGHWDAVFFLDIALSGGYRWDQFFAFLAGYPLLMWCTANSVLVPLSYVLSPRNLMLLAGALVSNVAFVVAAVMLYKLGCLVLHDSSHARLAALLFCINPSGVFCSALYTESLFCALTFTGMYCFELWHKQDSALGWLTSTVFLALASSTRSNGISNAIYFGHDAVLWVFDACSTRARRSKVLLRVAADAAACVAIAAPYCLHLWQGYRTFCNSMSEVPEWCSDSVPNIYQHTQRVYWGLGLWKYYEIKQLPNFALAAPVLVLSGTGILRYAKADPSRFFTGGLMKGSLAMSSSAEGSGFTGADTSTYVYHLLALLILTIPVIHIQVLTRLLVAMPSLYWHAAGVVRGSDSGRSAVLGYYLVYNAAGALLFPNFLPWT